MSANSLQAFLLTGLCLNTSGSHSAEREVAALHTRNASRTRQQMRLYAHALCSVTCSMLCGVPCIHALKRGMTMTIHDPSSQKVGAACHVWSVESLHSLLSHVLCAAERQQNQCGRNLGQKEHRNRKLQRHLSGDQKLDEPLGERFWASSGRNHQRPAGSTLNVSMLPLQERKQTVARNSRIHREVTQTLVKIYMYSRVQRFHSLRPVPGSVDSKSAGCGSSLGLRRDHCIESFLGSHSEFVFGELTPFRPQRAAQRALRASLKPSGV